MVPTQVHDIVQARLKAPSCLRAVLVGGAFLSPPLYQRGRALGWPLLPTYGMTECSSQIATAELSSLKADKAEANHLPKLKFLSHIKRVFSTEEGEVSIESPSLLTLQALLHLPTQKMVCTDPRDSRGAFSLPDRIVYEFPYLLKVLGRKEEEVKIQGELCHLNPLREILHEIGNRLGIQGEVEVIALPHPRSGHGLHLVTTRRASQEAEQLRAEFNQRVFSLHRLQNIYLVSAFPKSSLGKIKWKELQKLCLCQ